MKREIVSETPPPSGNPTAADDISSSYVTVEGIHINLPCPADDNSPAPHGDGNRGGRCFPVRITVRLIHPSPTNTNRLSILQSVLGYKTAYEFWLRRTDDSSGGVSGVETANWFVDLMNVTYSLRGVEVVNWLVDHMNLPFSLSGVKLLWNGFSRTKDGHGIPVLDCKTVPVTNDGCETPVADWDSMTVLIHEFLTNVTAEENRGCGINDLRITKYVILPEEERKAIIKRRNRDAVGRKWEDSVFGLQQRVMELRMKAVVEKAIERVTMEDCGGGGGEAVTCGICLAGMGDGSVVAGLAGCFHRFHERCIVEWLVHNMSCPFCRRPIRFSAAGDAPAAVLNNG